MLIRWLTAIAALEIGATSERSQSLLNELP